MERRELGRSGLMVARVGLGAGGKSRLGMARGRSSEQAADLVRYAIDRGVDYIDTAPSYGTEDAVGLAMASYPRHEVVVSTKVRRRTEHDELITPADLRRSLTGSLRRLRTDHVDVLFLHAVRANEYDHCSQVLAPEMLALREEGLARAIGVTEAFTADPGHEMLHRLLADAPGWDAVMAGFNVLNPSARSLVPQAVENGLGMVAMHATRWLLASVERLLSRLQELRERSDDAAQRQRLEAAVARLRQPDAATLLPAAAYHFALAAPGFASVLMGTGDRAHLDENLAAMEAVAREPGLGSLLDVLDALLEDLPEGAGNWT